MATGGCFLTVSVDLVADCVVDPKDLVDSVVDLKYPVDLPVDLYSDLVLRSVEASLLFTISVLCVERLDLCISQLTTVSVIVISVCDPQLAISVSDKLTTVISLLQNVWISDRVSHLMTYTKLQCCRSVVSYPVDYFEDPSHIDPVDLFADLPVDLFADPYVDLIFPLLPLCSMVSPLL